MRNETIQWALSRAAEEFGANIAIDHGDRRITYTELDRRASAIANLLTGCGAERGSIVAILSEDIVDTIISILGTLKAGCVFVPLDTGVPEKRLEVLASLVEPAWIITESKLAAISSRITRLADKNIICLDNVAEQKDLSSAPPRETVAEMEPDDLCYIYFTSGSTGRPKAIAGRLKGIDHFIRWEINKLGIDHTVRVSQLLPLSFDGSLRDLFVPICAGGTICIPPSKDTILNTRMLIEWIDGQSINLVHCVPSIFRAIVKEELNPELFLSLNHILMAGEPLLPADVAMWTDVFGERVQLVNLYGTSETTMAKFFYFVKGSDRERKSIPIGKPMEGATAIIVDSKGRPCPVHTVGEIYIRTPYRSLGYYNQPELTREVFIRNPFSDDPNDIIYKTGDLGRVLNDGNFEYLGRKDQQVKIRGVRIELEEIENLLRSHESVKDVAVVDLEDQSGFKYLSAFVVFKGERNLSTLREFCSHSLPDYMVPSAIVDIDELPMTISRKVDRRALKSRARSRAMEQSPVVAPRTPIQELLAGIWIGVLGIPDVSIRDNFFHIGGHSLLATQLLSRVRASFGVEIPLQALFRSPTIEGLAEAIEYARGQGVSSPAPPLRRRERKEASRLSYAQQRLWFLDQLEPGSFAYNIPSAVRLKGELKLAALEQSLSQIIRRHEILRSRIEVVEDEPRQQVNEAEEMRLAVIDLSSLETLQIEKEVKAVVEQEARRGFELSKGGLIRGKVVKVGAEEHILLITVHHIVADGWSMGVAIRELVEMYESYRVGERASVDELELQYVDYAEWQREKLEGDAMDRELKYWKEQLQGAPSALDLPADRPRPAVLTYRGASQSFSFSRGLSAALKALSMRENVTMFMTLLAGFKTLLHRYTSQTDILVGTPIANRNRQEIEGLIGFFVNTLVIRTDFTGNPSFQELLSRLRETALGAYAHQDLPFEKLVEELQPNRDMSHSPIFQVMFALQNVPMEEMRLEGLELAPAPINMGTAKFDLNLHVGETDQGLAGHLYYNTDLFDHKTMARLLAHFQTLLEAVVSDPARKISELDLLSHADREQIESWGRGVSEPATDVCAHTLFEAQVERTPDSIAVVSENEQITFAELNKRANQLASYLRSRGVGPESVVGICIERSLEMVIGLLAVFKAGGAYLGLDLELPKQRLSYMLEETSVRVIVAREAEAERLPASDATIILMDKEWSAIAAERSDNPDSWALADNLAYVIYTSGSTGQPKGAAGAHKQLVHYLRGILDRLDLNAGASFAMHQTFAVDAPITFFLASLCTGGVLHVISRERATDPEALGSYFEDRRIEYFKVAPSHLAALHSSSRAERIMPLRLLMVGGEASRRDWVKKLQKLTPDCQIVNHYGPTEATVGVLTYRVPDEGIDSYSSVLPLGFPIANTQISMLDSYLNRVPAGIPGELHISGACLSRGYINRPELTSAKFIPNPYTHEPGRRMYKTGDVASYRPDGNINFIGRIDHQVKVRAFRIELEEIEEALGSHPDVQAGVVVLRENAQGDNSIAAYFVSENKQVSFVGELRRYLKDRLPDYMIPATFMLLDSLPRTPQGKINRRALPVTDGLRPELESGFVAPQNPIQEKLAQICAGLLNLNRVGIYDNFFDLGGHSLLATQLISRLRSTFNVEIALHSLFEKPTVAEIAEIIAVQMQKEPDARSAPIVPASRAARRMKRNLLEEITT
ncbi:MAG: amino acid adenylation domain-containing protein [Blastocatellia bacterium]